ncbi:DNA-directed RNA polymerase subunit beta' [Candidatus Uhrbacteria bacterium]|nr:DNA-directed RNA polymerase subunit beta' [Candidatus Uhrbacteria bacterium]
MAHEEKRDSIQGFDFDAIRLKLASPDDIHRWSYGEVTRPETINYRTQRPEKDGLFSERIFGPTKDWECYCGKYKKIRYKGIICDKCGVEVTRSIVRRERMGHIDLATPVSHIWFLRGVPSKIGLVLDISVMNLEKIIYFASFIVTSVNERLKEETVKSIEEEGKQKKKQIENENNQKAQVLRGKMEKEGKDEAAIEKAVHELYKEKALFLSELDEKLAHAAEELKSLKTNKIISESVYRELSLRYGHMFEASIGAESLRKLLEKLDLKKLEKDLETEIVDAQGLKKEKMIRRLKLVKSLVLNGIRPEWMIMTSVPIIPPDLRPMVALDGGRFATSDLNDLYRRVINRNNRLKQLIELKAPEVICRNEKRMLQEAVDALIDNSARHGKTVIASTGQKRMLKSLADMLKGKRGRFRQNLLGKRIDYSGRSVIVVGPHLKLHQCGLPKRMALDLFKPFVMGQLIKQGYVYNVRSASRFIESGRDEVWDILEEIIKDSYVLLNRAPTLHRLGIQAFKPVLIEGKAIQIHPLVCTAFNADFDGDQMAVHVPLSDEAREEADQIMLASRNLLKPATGTPIVNPIQDIVWGAFYMTHLSDEEFSRDTNVKRFSDEHEARFAYSMGQIRLQEKIIMRPSAELFERIQEKDRRDDAKIETSVGRILFNEIFPSAVPFCNNKVDKKVMGEIVAACLEIVGVEETARVLDNIKELCGRYLTNSGLSFGMDDIPALSEKPEIIKKTEKRIEEVENQYEMGLLTFQERRSRIINIWTETRDVIAKLSKASLDRSSSVFSIIESGARGTWAQLNQIVGMKGLLASPSGEIIELAVKSSFKEGLGVLEYFISTHGARKGLVDTALRTSNAGYLTRRLVDVSQDVVVTDSDCGDKKGIELEKGTADAIGLDFYDRFVGRTACEDIVGKNGETIAKKNEILTRADANEIRKAGIEKISIRSLLSCKSIRGICQRCYGIDPAYNNLVKEGTAVGIIAAQSLGEPGTQLTMRTFHTGGVAGVDITQGLPRVEELFEARPPKNRATVAEIAGRVQIIEKQRVTVDAKGAELSRTGAHQKIIAIHYKDVEEDLYRFSVKRPKDEAEKKEEVTVPPGEEKPKKKSAKKMKLEMRVTDGASVAAGDVLFVTGDGIEVAVQRPGTVSVHKTGIKISVQAEQVREYIVPLKADVLVKDGAEVVLGDQLTEGNLDLQLLFKYKGRQAAQQYIISEIQRIYFSQGQKLNDKHIEVIVRQMFSRVSVTDSGETDLLSGEVIERTEFLEVNKGVKDDGKKEAAKGDELLMGITKASLSTRSWLSAASFQETARVLINAAVTGKADHLDGLKENVIIGRLIPVGTGYNVRKRRGT